MEKKVRLADIYVKIYNKRQLTMDDLKFLSKYDPECFAKTCQNLVYNIPETKELMKADEKAEHRTEEITEEKKEESVGEPIAPKRESMEMLFENLQKLEAKELPVQEVKSEKVKNLLGNLYMEMLFPHNDRDRYFEIEKEQEESKFNKKV